jgi:broad specificity phosphatase PhoE
MKLILTISMVLILCSCSSIDNPTTIYMVRHAEKVDEENPDPSLTRAGFTRAQNLKEALKEASIDAIIVSDLQRTHLTAQPLADYLNLQLIIIPIQELGVEQYIQGVADEINNNWSGKEVLVVTHNPLYQLIGQALNTPELPAIDDATGYDHFFIITKSDDPAERARLSHTRYGALP